MHYPDISVTFSIISIILLINKYSFNIFQLVKRHCSASPSPKPGTKNIPEVPGLSSNVLQVPSESKYLKKKNYHKENFECRYDFGLKLC